ncbi:hypothetical protein ONE63_001926 [Megalurothrips usitatus]|uniref:Uncharacterized protein n=1 Tax=Megalurothrips usitatus TaxID=439358 RepID=A0AAV7XE30_9NEOP|nr:hypothetical protein ONE63_001926 [Megalurothrips usitatus]
MNCVFILQESADQSIVALGRSFLKRTLDLYPPCTPKLRNYYIHVLNSSVNKVTIPVGLWSLRSFEYFDSVLMELEQHIEGLLNPSQLREKMKVPGIRKIVKPKRFTESVSPKKQPRRGSRRESNEDTDISELKDFDLEGLRSESQRKKQLAEDAIKAMSPEEKTSHIFSRFEILVDILERDLVIWFSRNSDYSKISNFCITRDRLVCPLVVMALWKPESDTGFDSVHCRRILALYGSAWMLQLHPHHLRTLSRLVGLIAEITAASEPNIGNVYPHVGDGCENLARKFGDVLSSTQMMPMKTKAVANLKPEWLRMLVSANMLRVNPSASSMDLPTLLQPMCAATVLLWVSFLEAVMGFYHVKEAMNLLKRASRGLLKDELHSGCAASSQYQLNYKALLREIMAIYKLSSQLELENNADVPFLIRELLAL